MVGESLRPARAPTGAVFLSYASQDAEAARKICEALRAAGVEVWFDQSELRGGDAWDQRIRHEIRDCALFIPIVSHHTQERLEGYFRHEWNLAIERTHHMAHQKPFLVPVVIDGTGEQEAFVPDGFRAVQWTHLPGGDTPHAFVERITRLLSAELSPLSTASGAASVGEPVSSRPTASQQTAIRSLAVLPLASLTRTVSAGRFADAMTEAVIMSLAQLRELRVASRTSVMHYRGSRRTLPQIGAELKVDALVEGAVQLDGRRVRINARLVRAADDHGLWAGSYDRDLRDVLKLQNEVARTIAQQIELKLTPHEYARLNSARTVDPEAYQLCIKGRHLWVKRTEESVYRAISCFQKAITVDAQHAEAYSGLADCYSSLGLSFDIGSHRPTEIQPRAKAAAERALRLDDSLADAHNSLAFVRLNYDWDWTGAEREFRRSLELNPGYPQAHHWYAHFLMSQERLDEALTESHKALELEPLGPVMNLHLGWHYWYSRQFEDALEQAAKTLELEPNYGLAYWYRGLAYALTDRYAQALRELSVAKRLLKSSQIVEADIGYVHGLAGDRAKARKIIATLERTARRRYVNPFELAIIHVGLGDREPAFACLETAFRERSDQLVYLRVDPRLDPIRDDPRFAALDRRVRAINGAR
jgi:TolB-like protein/Flp pilus assembly protein TadD